MPRRRHGGRNLFEKSGFSDVWRGGKPRKCDFGVFGTANGRKWGRKSRILTGWPDWGGFSGSNRELCVFGGEQAAEARKARKS